MTRTLAPGSAWLRFPDNLPVTAFLLTAILVAAYQLAPVVAEVALGRPASTAGVGLGLGILSGILCGGVVLAMTMGLRFIVRRAGIASVPVPKWLLGCIALAVAGAVVAMGASARAQVNAKEHAQRPRVIVESAGIVRMSRVPAGMAGRVEAPMLYSTYISERAQPSMEWNGRQVSFIAENGWVTAREAAGARITSTDLREFDYVGRINVLPFCRHADGRLDLAVLVTLRASSQRSMLLLYGADGAVIHQEHLERTRSASGSAGGMAVVQSEGGAVLVVDHGAVTAYSCSAR